MVPPYTLPQGWSERRGAGTSLYQTLGFTSVDQVGLASRDHTGFRVANSSSLSYFIDLFMCVIHHRSQLTLAYSMPTKSSDDMKWLTWSSIHAFLCQEPFPVGNNIRPRSGRNRPLHSSDTRGDVSLSTSPNQENSSRRANAAEGEDSVFAH